MKEKIMVGMSGGVDSTGCALILKNLGFDVAGMNCRFFCSDEEICGGADVLRAKAVCERLGIPFFTEDLRQEFFETVIKNFLSEYENGATPNPCVVCNKYMKFSLMHEKASRLGYEKIATGHYAVKEKQGERFLLKKGKDLSKDQSYVLYVLNQAQLSSIELPLGEYTKEEIRSLAFEYSLPNAAAKDSQDICFVPDGDYASFIERTLQKTFPDGDFVKLDGTVLGRHKGIIRYTIGQRRGLGLALPAPLYVFNKDTKKNQVILSDEKELFSKTLEAESINFIPFDKMTSPMRLKAKVRYKQKEQWARVEQTGTDTFVVEFEEPQRAIAKGQSVVLYSDEYLVGGGIIK